MTDPISSSIIGSALGFAARLAPEVMKYVDRELERRHEAKLQEMVVKAQASNPFAKAGGEVIAGDYETTRAVGELESAIARQITSAKSEAWNLFSVLVRPSTTYALVAVYVATKAWLMWLHPELKLQVYSQEDYALLAGVLAFWFADRTVKRSKA